jgi:hypothetical protein
VTAEFGCLRLERLSGDEEYTGLEIFLTTPFSYDYGISGMPGAPELTRAIFGLMPAELEQLVTTLRRGSFPVLGFSPADTKCSILSSVIPACWPHLVVSNLSLYGNVVSLEAFVRILICSVPQGHLNMRFPALQSVLKHLLRLMVVQRRGLPYCCNCHPRPCWRGSDSSDQADLNNCLTRRPLRSQRALCAVSRQIAPVKPVSYALNSFATLASFA